MPWAYEHKCIASLPKSISPGKNRTAGIATDSNLSAEVKACNISAVSERLGKNLIITRLFSFGIGEAFRTGHMPDVRNIDNLEDYLPARKMPANILLRSINAPNLPRGIGAAPDTDVMTGSTSQNPNKTSAQANITAHASLDELEDNQLLTTGERTKSLSAILVSPLSMKFFRVFCAFRCSKNSLSRFI